jgi:DNA invertase Pin-like site-specific DNA recombinase
VSTKRQVVSGLGLESQREIVHNYIHQKGKLIQEYVEQESGKNDQRVELAKALSTCQEHKAVLIIAKLDRLSRSVQFISTLMQSKIKFQALDLPDANNLTIHIFASMAQFERERISERIKNALHQKRIRDKDWKPGTNNLTDAGREKAHTTNYMKARTNTNIRHAWHYIQPLHEQGHTYQYIADQLNKEGYRTTTGKLFRCNQVWYIVQRFELQKGV